MCRVTLCCLGKNKGKCFGGIILIYILVRFYGYRNINLKCIDNKDF